MMAACKSLLNMAHSSSYLRVASKIRLTLAISLRSTWSPNWTVSKILLIMGEKAIDLW